METKIKLNVQGLTNSRTQSGGYALVLSDGHVRRLMIVVGVPEAQAIAIALEGVQPARPLTHDLFTKLAGAFHIQLSEVFINGCTDGVFSSELVFSDGIKVVRIDARTSDAVAIALRMNRDIYTTEAILDENCIISDEDEAVTLHSKPKPNNPNEIPNWLRHLRLEDLQGHLEQAIEEENYEFAKLCNEELLLRQREEKKA